VTHENNSADVSFQHRGPDSEEYTIAADSESVTNDSSSYRFSISPITSGNYDLKANTSDGEEAVLEDIMFDKDSPELTFPDRQFVGDNPTLTVKIRDDHSGPDPDSYDASVDNNANIGNIDGFDSCTPGNDCNVDIEIGTDDLNTNADFVLTLDAEDNVGNTVESDEKTKTFTYDGGYEADAPEIEGFDVDIENGVAAVNDDVDVDVNVPNIDEEISDAMQVECIVDSDVVDTTDWGDSNSFECELPIGEIENQEVDVEVRACDRVNHCKESSTRTVTFDANDPEVDSFDTKQEYRVFGDDFEVEYEASDEATSIENVQYFFSSAFTDGDGYDASAADGSFTVDTSKLRGDSNERTVYIRVQDEAGRWSSLEEESQIDFEYYPEAQPEISLNATSNFSVESGASEDLDVMLENPGKLRLENVNISLESQITDSSQNVEVLEGGETTQISFDLNPNESHLGNSDAEVSSSGPLDSETINIQVNANNEQKNDVDGKLENYSSRLEQLNSNISKLRTEGLEGDLNDTIESNTSDFKETVLSAQEHVDEGDYYKAYNVLENVDKEFSEANQSFSQVEKQHELNMRNEKMMFAGLAVLMLSLTGIYYSRSTESDFDLSEIGLKIPDRFNVPSLSKVELSLPDTFSGNIRADNIGSAVDEKLGSVKEFIQEEEEEVEEGFEGFR